VAGGCQSLIGIHERCEKSCFDEHARTVCDTDGNRRREACPAEAPLCNGGECVAACHNDDDCTMVAPGGACEKAICVQGACTIVARTGEACLDDGTCRGYACISPTTQLSLSLVNSCMRDSAGLVWCWGDNTNGQLGRPNVMTPSVPFLVPRIGVDLPRARAVSVGYGHSCAVLEDGTLACWGNNLAGQSNGVSPTDTPIEPMMVTLPGPVATVVTGHGHTCVQLTDNRIFCWGENVNGEVGSGSTAPFVSVPTEVTFPETNLPVSSLSTSTSVTCVTDRIDIFCWGGNKWGELGADAPVPAIVPHPVKVKGIERGGVFQIAVGWGFVCAVVEGHHWVQCWGNNRWGQLGDGTVLKVWGPDGEGNVADPNPRFVVQPNAIAQLARLDSVTMLVAGSGSHVCASALPWSPEILCWGENTTTEVGVLKKGPFPRPVRTFAKGAKQVATGDDHTCILRREDDGFDISCWGRGRVGQLGDGMPLYENHAQPKPTRVRFPDKPGGIVAVRASQ
jgi:alpha-tubulin suppressor-like RCC1 family protein